MTSDSKKAVVCTVDVIDYLSVTMLDDEGEKKEMPSTFTCIDHENGHLHYQLAFAGNTDADSIIHSPIFNGVEPVSGEVQLKVPFKSIVEEMEDSFIIDLSIKTKKVKVLSNAGGYASRRRLNRKEGDKNVVVYRVNTADDQPSK